MSCVAVCWFVLRDTDNKLSFKPSLPLPSPVSSPFVSPNLERHPPKVISYRGNPTHQDRQSFLFPFRFAPVTFGSFPLFLVLLSFVAPACHHGVGRRHCARREKPFKSPIFFETNGRNAKFRSFLKESQRASPSAPPASTVPPLFLRTDRATFSGVLASRTRATAERRP